MKEEEHAQLRAIASGIEPLLVKEVVDEFQQEERKIREKLRGLQGTAGRGTRLGGPPAAP